MTQPTRSLPQQLSAVEHAAAVLGADEEVQPGLAGAARTIAWTDKHQATIRAVVEYVKVVARNDALEVLSAFATLAGDEADVIDLLLEFRALKAKHPEIIAVLEGLRGGNLHVKTVGVREGHTNA